MSVQYRLIRPDELDRGLIEAWRELQAGTSAFHGPCFSPEFTQCVGEVRADARVVVIENDGHVVGFFPFQLGAFGVGRPIGGAVSDFHGVIAEPSAQWSVSDLLATARLSVWTFDHLVAAGDCLSGALESAAQSPQIDLSDGYAEYVRRRRAAGSDYIPKTEGLARKLGREIGDLEFTLNDRTPGAFATLIEWKSRQYRGAGLADVFAVPWTVELLDRVRARVEPVFSGLCSVLRVDGRTVAGHIGMRSADVLHYWFPTYDTSYARFSPGIIVLLRLSEALAAEGVRTVDLGKGDSSYKTRLMTGAIEVGAGRIERSSTWLARFYRLRHRAETLAQAEGSSSLSRLPHRILQRFERAARFR